MGMLDRLKGKATKAKQQAEAAAGKHSDKIGSGLDKAADQVNRRTGHKYDDKIDKGVSKAKERLAPEEQKPGEAQKRDDEQRP